MAALSPDLPDFRAEPIDSVGACPAPAVEAVSRPRFEAIYDEHFDLVWRGLRGLGVPEASVDDAVQDVFLAVHRRLPEFEARSSVKTWVFGIVLHIARNHRRLERRKGGCAPLDIEPVSGRPGPHEEATTAEALRRLAVVLGDLDEQKREVFVLAELEQLTAPEIAETLGINVNTAYSRLRAARCAFDAALARREGGDR